MIIPLIVEHNKKKKIIITLSDIDGTITDETLPESKRITSIEPAKQAIEKLQSYNIPVGVITARGLGEAQYTLEKINGHGCTIAEDGAVLLLPFSNIDTKQVEKKFRFEYEHGYTVLLLSKVGRPELDKLITKVEQEAKKQNPMSPHMISSAFDSAEELFKIVKHETIDITKMSLERFGSEYIPQVTDLQLALLHQFASNYGVRVVHRHRNDTVQLNGADANKGHAIEALDQNISLFYPQIPALDGIIPIVFGNAANDIPLFKKAIELGGVGIMVTQSNGIYAVNKSDIPPQVILAEKPYGYGMKGAISEALDILRLKYKF